MNTSREEIVDIVLSSSKIEAKYTDKLRLLFNRISINYPNEVDFYRIITNIVDRYSRNDALNPFISSSLNKLVPGRDKTEFIDLLKSEILSPLELLVAKEKIEQEDLELPSLYELLNETNLEKYGINDKILSLPGKAKKIELLKKCMINGRIIIPHKKIVSFFGNGELFNFIKGMPYSKILTIYQAHNLGMNGPEASKFVGVHHGVIYRYWQKANLKSPNKKDLPELIDKILEAHKLKLSTRRAAKYVGNVSHSYITKVWEENGLKPIYNPIQELTLEQRTKIKEANDMGMSIPQAAKYAKCSKTSVHRVWKEENLETNFESGSPIPRATKKEIDLKVVEAHKKGMSTYEAEIFVGISSVSIGRRWKKLGLKSNYLKGWPHKKRNNKV